MHAAGNSAQTAATERLLAAMRTAQRRWRQTPVPARLRVLRALRREIASGASELAATVPLHLPGALHRNLAETLTAEVLPLAEACRYLEVSAKDLLASRRESSRGRPVWLWGTTVETRRLPLGIVLILAPANYPLLLPGVQALQALAAGNAVLWKPAPETSGPAHALRAMLLACGLDERLLQILPERLDEAQEAIRAGVDKIFLTGSAHTGRAVMHQLADKLTPSVMELSGCDAVFVLEGADIKRAADAVAFGLRLNGSNTCMATRRVLADASVAPAFIEALTRRLAGMEPVPLTASVRTRLLDAVQEATLFGAKVLLDGMRGLRQAADEMRCGPTILTQVTPEMTVANTDIFAPVLSVLPFDSVTSALRMHRACRYQLTAAIFGPERNAMALAAKLDCGTVLLNDVIVSTADPRVSFGGRGQSGFGVTRGPEGLLEMTAVQTVIRNRTQNNLAYRPVNGEDAALFAAWTRLCHGGWKNWPSSLKQLIAAGRQWKQNSVRRIA
jgi:aldehyde dehydrogenase (NAD+)